LSLAKPHVDVAVDLFQAPPELFNAVYRVFDSAGQVAHLRFQPIHAKFGVDRRAGACQDRRAPAIAIDLPLQHAEVPLQAV
jgi:hypothetical protein